MMRDLRGLPGAELVGRGLRDLEADRLSAAALAVAAAGARLRRLGFAVRQDVEDAELRLYQALGEDEPSSAYARYNSIRREIVSFARALEREEGSALRAG
jgi:hypothetical protein